MTGFDPLRREFVDDFLGAYTDEEQKAVLERYMRRLRFGEGLTGERSLLTLRIWLRSVDMEV